VAVLTSTAGGAQQPVGGLLGALGEALTSIAKDDSVRAVVLARNGPAFCAGHDLKELTAAAAMPTAAAPISSTS
jgi:enoyl-CoA hydratase/carnithine racemase